MITIRTAQHQRVIDLQKGSKWKAPISRSEAEAQVERETFNHTHVATCEGVKPIYATISDNKMVVRQSNGFDDYLEQEFDVDGERDAIKKLSICASEIAKSVLSNL